MKIPIIKVIEKPLGKGRREIEFFTHEAFHKFKMKTNGIKITKLSILKVLERQNTKMFLKFLEKKMVVFNIDDNAHENMEKSI